LRVRWARAPPCAWPGRANLLRMGRVRAHALVNCRVSASGHVTSVWSVRSGHRAASGWNNRLLAAPIHACGPMHCCES
jgi:hypothetical protein